MNKDLEEGEGVAMRIMGARVPGRCRRGSRRAPGASTEGLLSEAGVSERGS